MPPVTKAGGEQFRKDVPFTSKDADEQIAAGIVMVPDKVDLQNDFAREETIREFADQFQAFYDADEAGGGIMHSVFPDGWMELERSEVLDEAEEIGGQTVEAGAWVQEWRFNDDGLWSVVDDGLLAGYSIGAIQVDWNGPHEQGDVDDIEVPDGIPDEALVWELVSGLIREVSAVDVPAVPDAQILETKTATEKRLGDYLGDRDGFVEEALARNPDWSEDDAERLWDVMSEAVEAEGSSEPGKMSFLERIGKAAVDAFTGDGSANISETPDTDPRGTAKEGRTLSSSNRESAMAAVDANLDILQDAGVEHGMTRFTDQDGVDFDLSEHDAREFDDPDEDDEETDVSPINNAAGGDTPDDKDSDMTDNPDGEDDDKSLAEQNAEQINDLTQAVENLTESLTGPEAKTAEIEIDGETYEVREDAAKAVLGADDDVSVAEAIENLNEKAARVDEVEQRLDTITQQSGVSTQLEAAAGEGEDGGDDEGGLKALGGALS
ncbi:XkdF-like putative serine protease domain-containing protein [Natrialba aegyptia]|uniref:Phage-like element PBSX protein XkdF domain-containing protein n=1 Tax=Natrialba aegyptia DSM 13077 TaxID=1227491 RepID=M0B7I1_9EURY|nr:XkdF-like putative serine protease domain-containing protein [Natrialba aegyptia]ELZ05584.1 hypothetical protein C480_10400 [Natrialba aegyptia DSM 13077]